MIALLLLAALHAAPPPPPALEAVRQRVRVYDFRASGRLVRVVGSDRTTWKFTVRGHWFPEGLHLLYDITAPDGKKLTRNLVRMDLHGRVSTPVATPVPGLFFEDLVENEFFWSTQAAEGSATIGSRTCTTLRSTATAGESARYSSVLACVDASTGLPLHTAKSLRSSGQTEDFAYGNLRQEGGQWIATQVTIQIPGQPGSTLVLLDRGTPHAHLGLRDFDPSQAPAAEDR